MRNLITSLLLLNFLSSLLAAQKPSSNQPIVLTHVTIIDMTGEPPKPDMTVVIVGQRIDTIGRTGKVRVPKDSRIVDADGKYLVPGFWDMHVHLSLATEIALPLLLANGVTGIREMGGDLKQIDAWRNRIAAGELLGPQIVRAGPVVDGPKDADYRLTITNPIEARNAVRQLKRLGVDFIKIHNAVPREAYFALADEAKKLNISFAGHIPAGITAAEASDAGQKSIEHTESLLDFPVAEAMKRTKDPKEIFNQALAAYNEDKAKLLFRRFAKNGTWFVPTLVEYQAFAFRADIAAHPDERNKYVAASAKEYWNKTFPVRGTAETFAARKSLLQKFLEFVGEMRREEVSVMTGTDLGVRDVYPGFSLHNELELLVKAGFSPLEALQSATVKPAKFLGLEKSLGTIEKGKTADLVLLEANPLENIANTKKISAVITKGRYLPNETLQKMLADVEAIAGEK
jgi:imidazolonepropionase-like amidohydrolase